LRRVLADAGVHRESYVLEPTGNGGAPVYLDLTAYYVPVRGTPHVALLCRDVSERYEYEARLQRSRHLESLERLASGVAHDLGTLLTIIWQAAELMRIKAPDNGLVGEATSVILRTVDSASSLMRQLFAFSREEEIEFEVLHVNLVIRRVEASLRLFMGSDIELRFDLTQEGLFVRGDQGQLVRVLLNLVSNARDALPEGGTVCIQTRLQELDESEARRLRLDPGLYAVLSVSDNGIGLDDDMIPSLFDPFYTTKKPEAGRPVRGLGLSVVYGVLQQHHGQVDVESQPGRGTTFRVYFPAIDVEEAIQDGL
jgi:hypothetical protein